MMKKWCLSGAAWAALLLSCAPAGAKQPYAEPLADGMELTPCACSSEAGEGVIASGPRLTNELGDTEVALPSSTSRSTAQTPTPDEWGSVFGSYSNPLIGLIDDTVGVGRRLAAVDFVRTFDNRSAVSARASAWELFKANLTRLSQAGMQNNVNLIDGSELPLDGEFALAIAAYERNAEHSYAEADRLNPAVAERQGLPFYFTLHATEQALLLGAGRATVPGGNSTAPPLTLPPLFSRPTPTLALAGGGMLPTLLAEESTLVGATAPATSAVPQLTAAMMSGSTREEFQAGQRVSLAGGAGSSKSSALDEIADTLEDIGADRLRIETRASRAAMIRTIATSQDGADVVRARLADVTAYSHEEAFDIFRAARLAAATYREATGLDPRQITANDTLIEVARDALRLRGLDSARQAQRFDILVRQETARFDQLAITDRTWTDAYGFALEDLLARDEGTAISWINRLESEQGLMRLRNNLIDMATHNPADAPRLGRLVEAVRLRYGTLSAEIQQPVEYY